MEYEWDEHKRNANKEKHDVDFSEAYRFDWRTALIQQDNRRDYGEERFKAMGFVGERLHIIVYTLRGGTVRIIGMRRANDKEENFYEEKTA